MCRGRAISWDQSLICDILWTPLVSSAVETGSSFLNRCSDEKLSIHIYV